MVYRTGDIVSPKIHNAEPLRLEAEHFLHCVSCGARSAHERRDGPARGRLLEAADASLHEGAPKAVELPSLHSAPVANASAADAPAPAGPPAGEPAAEPPCVI